MTRRGNGTKDGQEWKVARLKARRTMVSRILQPPTRFAPWPAPGGPLQPSVGWTQLSKHSLTGFRGPEKVKTNQIESKLHF